MNTFPKSLEEAVAQAKEATKAALADGYTRLQVELLIPEIALQAQALALEFSSIFDEYGSGLKILFPDAGAAALARRDWQQVPFQVTDLGSRFTQVESQVALEDEAFIVVCPSSVEVEKVEKLCNVAGDRPVVLLIPQLEDVSVVGIGLAARKLRERFISTLYSCYYLRPLEGAAVFRSHPSSWQIWLETEEEYQLATELSQKPIGEDLELLLMKLSQANSSSNSDLPQPKKTGILGNLQRFLKALSQ
jgi:hypothetical protein